MIEEYNDKYLEDSLRGAFVGNEKCFIYFDWHSARNSFLRDGVNLGVERGWLKSEEFREEQCTYIEYRLTDKGKRYFELVSNGERV